MVKILIIGEKCKDVFIYGESKRLSPEAPVPVFAPLSITENDGMSGNVFANIIAISHKVNISVDIIHQNVVITKTRYIDGKTNHIFIRVDEGEQFIDPFIFTSENKKKINSSDVVIVSDYNKKFLDEKSLIKIGKMSKFSIIDTKRNINKDFIQYFNFVKVNRDEYYQNKKIFDKHIDKIIITLGRDGVMYKNNRFPSPDPKETIDVSGAGDTFTAAFTLKYLETKKIEDSILFANQMSSIVVSKRGVATP